MLNLVFFVIAVALVFDFLNGFHDAANSVATVVTTRVLSPLPSSGRHFSILSRHLSSAQV
jgi:phosphate/sulfate permease